jgi:hypothetical protein
MLNIVKCLSLISFPLIHLVKFNNYGVKYSKEYDISILLYILFNNIIILCRIISEDVFYFKQKS